MQEAEEARFFAQQAASLERATAVEDAEILEGLEEEEDEAAAEGATQDDAAVPSTPFSPLKLTQETAGPRGFEMGPAFLLFASMAGLAVAATKRASTK